MPTVEVLDQCRADYLPDVWRRYDLLYEGGYKIRQAVREFLKKHPFELASWYEQRLARFHFVALAAPIVDEYVSSVFQTSAQMLPAKNGGAEAEAPPAWYADEFLPNPCCDHRGDFDEYLFHALLCSLRKRETWTLVTFPDAPAALPRPEDRAQQDEAGLLRARLMPVDPLCVIDAGWDDQGLVYAMVKTRQPIVAPLVPDGKKDRIWWTLYQREAISRWELEIERDRLAPDKTAEPTQIVSDQRHRMAGHKRVPLVCLRQPDGLWLMDRLGDIAEEYLRKRNSIAWFEDMVCFPQLTHEGDETLQQAKESGEAQERVNTRRGVQHVWEIAKGDTLEWLEPKGHSIELVNERTEKLVEAGHRVAHLMASAIGPHAARAVQSAASKVRDSVQKRVVCERYAQDVRRYAAEIMNLVSIGRGEPIEWATSGLDQHDVVDAEAVAAEGLTVQGLNVPSLRFKQLYAKRLVRLLLPGEETAELDAIKKEIDSAKAEDFAIDTSYSDSTTVRANE